MDRKRAIALSHTVLAKLRKYPAYRHWKKEEFIRCQCLHENSKQPDRLDKVGQFDVLSRFAIRLGLSVPTKTIKMHDRVYQ